MIGSIETAPLLRELEFQEVPQHLEALVGLLRDAVEGGASVGFLPPLSDAAGRAYWEGVHRAVGAGSRVLFAAFEGDRLVGSVQLDLAWMPNGQHRAEVMKLFVERGARRKGIGRALMAALEAAARRRGRQLLVLDTREGDSAERLYTALGYTRAGVIPRYARSATGELDATVLMYRWLE